MDMKILKTAAEELNEIPVFFCSFVLFCFLNEDGQNEPY